MKKKFGNLFRTFIGSELWIIVAGAKDLEVKTHVHGIGFKFISLIFPTDLPLQSKALAKVERLQIS